MVISQSPIFYCDEPMSLLCYESCFPNMLRSLGDPHLVRKSRLQKSFLEGILSIEEPFEKPWPRPSSTVCIIAQHAMELQSTSDAMYVSVSVHCLRHDAVANVGALPHNLQMWPSLDCLLYRTKSARRSGRHSI